MKKASVSIIILSYNTKDFLKSCLKSVIREVEGIDSFELIVVDNGSKDGSQEVIKSIKSKAESKKIKFTLVENKKNLGFAKGNNQGVKIASGKYLFFLNSDSIVEEGSIGKLVDYLETYSKVAAVSPLLLNKDDSLQKDPCYLKFPSPIFTIFYYNKFSRIFADKFFPKLIYSVTNFEASTEIDQLPGAAFMIRKGIFVRVGGFSEDYPHFFEDVDLSYRLKKAGYQFFLVPQSRITHFGGKSLESRVKKEGVEIFYLLSFQGLLLFCQKNYPPIEATLIKIIVFLHLFLRFRFDLIKKLYQ